jgi:hypothetical protein
MPENNGIDIYPHPFKPTPGINARAMDFTYKPILWTSTI